MLTQTLTLELPDEIVRALGSVEAATAKARESFVLDLLREAIVSQGQAADLLGINRWDLLELMAQRRIPSGPETAEEMAAEIEAMRHYQRRA
jgi:predicted HTH domain antitoxin